MTTSASNRTCGRCGAAASAPDETCPGCGALLAAYEPPRGSEEGGAAYAAPSPTPPLRATAERDTPMSHPPRERRPVTQPDPPAAPVNTRRMGTSNVDALPDTTPDALASSRKKVQPVPPRGDRARQAGPPPVNQASRQGPGLPRQVSTRESTTAAASPGRIALVVLLILAVLGALDFNPVPILMAGGVLLAVLGIMRAAARASGRKTTSMHDPRGPGRRR